jgi:hypothetical protein
MMDCSIFFAGLFGVICLGAVAALGWVSVTLWRLGERLAPLCFIVFMGMIAVIGVAGTFSMSGFWS